MGKGELRVGEAEGGATTGLSVSGRRGGKKGGRAEKQWGPPRNSAFDRGIEGVIGRNSTAEAVSGSRSGFRPRIDPAKQRNRAG